MYEGSPERDFEYRPNSTWIEMSRSVGFVSVNQSPRGKNLRHYHRIPTEIEAVALDSKGSEHSVTVANISRAGLMLVCNRNALDHLFDGENPVLRNTNQKIKVQFNLPVETDAPAQIKVICRSVYARRLSKDCFHVGFEFTDFDGDSLAVLDKHLFSEELPAPDETDNG